MRRQVRVSTSAPRCQVGPLAIDPTRRHVSVDGRVIDLAALNALWRNYLVTVNGGPDATIPYLALIRDKLRDVAIGGGTTLEEIVAQMMKPMLAAWLDEHLPEIVERVVQQEVERAARGGGRRR